MQDSYEFDRFVSVPRLYELLKAAAKATDSTLQFRPDFLYDYNPRLNVDKVGAIKPGGNFTKNQELICLEFLLERDFEAEEKNNALLFKEIKFVPSPTGETVNDGRVEQYVTNLISAIDQTYKASRRSIAENSAHAGN